MKRIAETKAALQRRSAASKMAAHKNSCPVCSKETVPVQHSASIAGDGVPATQVTHAFVLCKEGALLTEQKAFFEGWESGIWRGVDIGRRRKVARRG